ncbi:MAG: hypothetical protein IPM43_12490 [Actinomycetota bacterium]|nr:MAG: hypothetical protein IPM43_12490 [Actinomycetota bacterium]
MIAALMALGTGCVDGKEPTATNTTTPTDATTQSNAGSGAPTTSSESTEPPAPQTTSTDSPTTSAPETGDALQRWIDGQIEAGRTQGYELTGEGTDARLVIAYRGAFTDVAAIMELVDGTLIELPAGLPRGPTTPYVAGIGGRPALVGRVDDHLEMWVLDASTGSWSDAIALGVLADNQAVPTVFDLDGRLFIANETVRDDGTGSYVPDRQEGVIVAPDLVLTAMTAPPPGLFMGFTATVGSSAFVLGRDIGGGGVAPLTEPWQFDASTNEWSLLPSPPWLDCSPNCTWGAPHEYGDVSLEVALDDSLIKMLPDGTIGLYSPASESWRQMGAAPFALQGPATATLGDVVVVAPQPVIGLDLTAVAHIGALDTTSGQWSTTPLADLGASTLVASRRELRTDGRLIMIGFSSDGLPPTEPTSVFDPATATWRPPSTAELSLWTELNTLGDGTLQSLAD